MTHFAHIVDGVVTKVIVAEQDYIDNHETGTWVQTSYNTKGGVHYGSDLNPDGGVALRKNFAGIGSTYDSVKDAFYLPQPYPSWTLNTESYLWVPPVARPRAVELEPVDGKRYEWNEELHQENNSLGWVEVEV